MKKETVIRSILFVIVIVNMILKYTGHDLIIDADESDVYNFVEMVISVAILILSWWKNNSFTQNAIKADEYLEKLKNFDEEE